MSQGIGQKVNKNVILIGTSVGTAHNTLLVENEIKIFRDIIFRLTNCADIQILSSFKNDYMDDGGHLKALERLFKRLPENCVFHNLIQKHYAW